jgi:excisionase family DNA binding protein
MTEPYMTPQEAADYLRLDVQTVYKRATAGTIPCHRRGRLIRFRRSELDAWLRGDTSEEPSHV